MFTLSMAVTNGVFTLLTSANLQSHQRRKREGRTCRPPRWFSPPPGFWYPLFLVLNSMIFEGKMWILNDNFRTKLVRGGGKNSLVGRNFFVAPNSFPLPEISHYAPESYAALCKSIKRWVIIKSGSEPTQKTVRTSPKNIWFECTYWYFNNYLNHSDKGVSLYLI